MCPGILRLQLHAMQFRDLDAEEGFQEVFEMACLCRIAGVTYRDKIRNTYIKDHLNWKEDTEFKTDDYNILDT